MTIDKSLQLRLDKYIIKSDNDCWIWIGATSGNSAVTTIKGKTASVKKILYTDFNRISMYSGYLHSSCHNKKCVNPQHLLSRDQYFMTFFEINAVSGCWEWLGKKRGGYGMFSADHKNHLAHRLMYVKYNGNIPENKNVCHKCDNPSCVNPQHLWLGTHQENMTDMITKKRDKKSYGSANHLATITEKEAREIKIKHKEGMNMREIHRALNISYRVIQHICAGESWKHIVI